MAGSPDAGPPPASRPPPTHRARPPRGPGAVRWGRIVFLVVTVWITAAMLVVFFRGFPQARLRGEAEQVATRFQPSLGAGWYPLEVDQVPSTAGSSRLVWIGLNYSRGTTSTLDVAPGWRRLSLRLSPVPCANGQPQRVSVQQGPTTVGHLALAPGWSWYSVRLHGQPRRVSLHYSCVLTQRTPGLGLQGARTLAVALAGIRGG